MSDLTGGTVDALALGITSRALPERRLWCAVLLAALDDFRAGGVEADRVNWWLTGPDFVMVCELAGYEPDTVRKAFRSCQRVKLTPQDARSGPQITQAIEPHRGAVMSGREA